jgi:predicted MPP superfamily phosphohydrolase
MRLAWLTDIHLNFVDGLVVDMLADSVRDTYPDAVLIGGDIAEAGNWRSLLERIAARIRLPIYFVLGNHDFDRGSIAAVRATATELTILSALVQWLPVSGVVSLTSRTALVGHDGWGDGGYGNPASSSVILNDFFLIEELRNAGPDLFGVLRRLGEEAAAHFQTNLPMALAEHEHVIALTHVPPFRESAWHQGRQSEEDWLPYFACRAVGEVLRTVMTAHPQRRLTVLCGHTHGAGECQVLPNLTVVTGGAEYGRPRLQRMIEVL